MNYYIRPSFSFVIPEGGLDKKIIETLRQQTIFHVKRYDPSRNSYKQQSYQSIIEVSKNSNTFKSLKEMFPKSDTFFQIPTSFLFIFKEKFNLKFELPVKLEDYFDKEKLLKDNLWSLLRDYQKKAVWTTLNNYRGIIKAPTGSGKTYMILAILKALKPDKLALVIVPKSSSLLIQTLNVASKFFPKEELGYFFGRGKKEGRITFSTINSLKSIPYLDKIDCLIIDECQATPATTIVKVIPYMTKSWLRYGFSGTPFGRSDERDFITKSILGDIIYEVKYEELIEKDLLSTMEYRMILFETNKVEIENKTIPVQEHLYYMNNFSKIMRIFIENSSERIALIVHYIKKTLEEGRNVLVISDRINLIDKIALSLNVFFENLPYKVIVGEINTKQRQQIFEDFKSEKIKVIIASPLIEYGIDLPNLNTVILASIGKSPIQLLQRIGRGLRKSDKHLIVYDFVERNNKVLIEQAKKRKKILEKCGFKVNLYKHKISKTKGNYDEEE